MWMIKAIAVIIVSTFAGYFGILALEHCGVPLDAAAILGFLATLVLQFWLMGIVDSRNGVN
jgi:hypothetical protein